MIVAPPGKLSFGEIFAESFGFFFGNIRLFFHLVTIPWILSLAIRVAGALIAAESVAAAEGHRLVRLYTNQVFAENIALYRRLGYLVEREEAIPVAVVVHMLKHLP